MKYKVKFEVLGKNFMTEVDAETPYGAIASVEQKIKQSFKIHATDTAIDSELDALGKVIFGEGWKTKPNF